MKINKNKKEEGKEKKKGNKGQVSQKEPWIERLKKKKKEETRLRRICFPSRATRSPRHVQIIQGTRKKNRKGVAREEREASREERYADEETVTPD